MAKKRKAAVPRVEVAKNENVEESVLDISNSKKKKRKSKVQSSFSETNDETILKTQLDDEIDTTSYAETNESESSLGDDHSKNNNNKKKKKKKSQDADSLSAATSADSCEPKDNKVNGLIDSKNETKRVWSKELLEKLLHQIESNIPKKDNLKYSLRLAKLDWQAISFDDCRADECQEIWRLIQSKLRTYRIFKEVLDDAKKYIENDNPVLDDNHPDKPQKPLSSYMLFQKDVKKKIIDENPGIHSIIDVSKLIAAKWNTLSEKKREKYKNKAIKLREEYEEQLKSFYEKHPDIPDPKKSKPKPKSKLDDLGFAKPKSPFQLFLYSMREKDPHSSASDLQEKSKTKWTKLSEKKKAIWIELAQKEEADYQENLRKYQSEHPDYKAPPLKTLISKRDKNILNHVSGKPEKPAGNGYSLYSRESLQNGSLKDIDSKSRLAEIAKRWKALAQSERDSYDSRAKQMMNEYKIKYQQYLDTLSPEKRILEQESTQPKRKKPESKEAPKSKKKKVTEPEKPPENAFELFKEKNKNEWNSKSAAEMENQAKLKWKKLSNADKKSYAEQVENLKRSYVTKLSQYLKFCPPEKLQEYVSSIAWHNQTSTTPVTLSSSEADSD
ncbi:nucleolar transcription factor 1-like [Planococcus citri]|uniref:nucleolar transcription factor 1-like n=1 Tax=Planococcus citri TaxID=170843 RepID=UPI0031F7A214